MIFHIFGILRPVTCFSCLRFMLAVQSKIEISEPLLENHYESEPLSEPLSEPPKRIENA